MLVQRLRIVTLLLAGSAGACGDDDLERRHQALTRATSWGDFSRPEVGRVNWDGSDCVGTLVDPQLVLTAAHCIGYWDGAPQFTTFYVSHSYSLSYAFPAGHIINLGYNAGRRLTPAEVQELPVSVNQRTADGRGNDDLAIVVLRSRVPDSIARPGSVSSAYPASGENVAVGGRHHAYLWYAYTAGPSQPRIGVESGDSGGPHFFLPPPSQPGSFHTRIFGVTSSADWWGTATLGNVVYHHDRIQQAIARGRQIAAEFNATTGPGSF